MIKKIINISNDKTFQVKMWPISCLNDSETYRKA